MKTAIIIIGHIRTWSECKNNFIETFGYLNPDVYVSTYDLQYNYHPAQQGWMNGTADSYLTISEIKNLFTNINLIELDFEKIDEVNTDYNKIKNKLHQNFQNEMNTYLQYRKISRCVELIKNFENKNKFKYDFILKIRADIYHNKFENTITNNNVIISDGNVFPNDVIIAASRDNFINITNFFDTEFYNPIFSDSHLKAPHNLLLSAFKNNNLNIEEKNLMNHVVRKTGKHYYNSIK